MYTINIKHSSVKLSRTIFIREGSKFKYGEIDDGDAVTAKKHKQINKHS